VASWKRQKQTASPKWIAPATSGAKTLPKPIRVTENRIIRIERPLEMACCVARQRLLTVALCFQKNILLVNCVVLFLTYIWGIHYAVAHSIC
jgi:hypothetical protein